MKRFCLLVAIAFLLFSCYENSPGEKTNKVQFDSITNDETYKGPHYIHEEKFGHYDLETEDQWDSLNGINNNYKLLKQGKTSTEYRTFGWHVYSNGTAYKSYDFSMLWGVSYFSYIVNPETGSYKEIHQWKTTALVDSAKANDCKVFLTISNFGKQDNELLLNDSSAQETLIDSVSALLKLRKADGINIDFEGVGKDSRQHFSRFLIKISRKLREVNEDYLISLCLYAVDYHEIFDIELIGEYIDFYVLMAYDYYGSFSKYAGPVAPFTTSKVFGKNCMKSSVEYYLDKGVKPSDLIVALPYYGAEWVIENQKIPSKVQKFWSHPPFRSVERYYIDSLQIPVLFNQQCSCTYMNIVENKDAMRQLWFEDSLSLSVKYDWIKNKKISGVGIWALGYDNGYSELWDLLAAKFCKEEN